MMLGIALLSIAASPVLACVPPPEGESPGYWKNEVRRYYTGKMQGRHEEVAAAGGIEALTDKINDEGQWTTGMWYNGYWLPVLPDLDGGGFDIDDAYVIFWNGPSSSTYKYLWKGLANWYNWAIGWGPVG